MRTAFTRNGEQLLNEAFAAGIQPESRLSIVEWSEKFRYLSDVETAEPGYYKSSRVPFWREPMDCMTPGSGVKRCVVMKAAQTGATVFALNIIGYTMAEAPCPMMLVLPDLGLARRYSSQRIDPMLNDSPVLRGLMLASRGREAQSAALWKRFPGGVLAIVGANSPSGFRSTPARRLIMDEVDAFPGVVGEEGDPVRLARRALTNFESTGQELAISTPTIEGRSRISTLFKNSDRRYYNVPCPLCGEPQVLKWSGIEWDEGDPSSVRYICTHCERPFTERFKTAMLEAGVWIPTNNDPELEEGVRGYHLSSLYSPLGWLSWKKIVQEFLEAKKKPAELRVWVNHRLGETWKETGDAPPWEDLYRRREEYAPGIVPAGRPAPKRTREEEQILRLPAGAPNPDRRPVVLTAGVDVQQDRLELEVVGWGPGLESWSISYLTIPFGPSDPQAWKELDGIIDTDWPVADRRGSIRIRMVAIDAGYATMHVRHYVRRRREPGRVLAIRGTDNAAILVSQPRSVDVTIRGRKAKGAVKEWSVGGPVAKGELYAWLQQKPQLEESDPYPPGWCHFPQYDAEYFRQLTAEEIVSKMRRGYPVYTWEKKRDRNEALDCRVYARAAAHVLGIDRWDRKPERWVLEGSKLGAAPGAGAKQRRKRPRSQRRDGGGWMDGFR